MADLEQFDADADYTDPATKKRPYRPVFIATENRTYLGLRDGYYEASHALVTGIIEQRFNEAFEGVAAVFLFRHYVELSLKTLIYAGRHLKSATQNNDEVERLRNTHRLDELWCKAIADAKPKIDKASWNQWDVEFLKQSVFELDRVDSNGEAYRYSGGGAERYVVNFAQLSANMVHVHIVFERMISWLIETHGENADYEDILRSY